MNNTDFGLAPIFTENGGFGKIPSLKKRAIKRHLWHQNKIKYVYFLQISRLEPEPDDFCPGIREFIDDFPF